MVSVAEAKVEFDSGVVMNGALEALSSFISGSGVALVWLLV
jgi:hypothetical protein